MLSLSTPYVGKSGKPGCYTQCVKAKPKGPNPAGRAGAPVSLYPLTFKEAVAGLAQVKMPEPDKKKPKATPKKGHSLGPTV
jgi:hypothetical protein